MQTKPCQHCRNLFMPRKDSVGIFCSKSCNAKHHNTLRPKRQKEKNPTTNCNNCGIAISIRNKFCSRSCSVTFHNKLRAVTETKDCPQCKCLFTGKTKFCSRRCGWDNKKKNRSTDFLKARNRETYRRYIAKRKFQTPIGADIKAIQEFYLNCPLGHEVDHIIPISKGGSHSLDNLQYLTKEENRKKSNKIL